MRVLRSNSPQLAAGKSYKQFDPSFLFRSGEQGVWYDPSDFSSMYQDPVGQSPVTAVGQAVAILLDKSKGMQLGPEIIQNNTFTYWTNDNPNSWSYSFTETATNYVTQVADGLRYVSDGALMSLVQSGCTTGKIYKITITLAAVTSGACVVQDNAGQVIRTLNTAGTYEMLYTANGPSVGFKRQSGVTDFVVSRFSVMEVLGNHAIQPTPTTARPILRGESPTAFGPELIANGTFDPNTTGWLSGLSAKLSVVDNKLRVENTIADYGSAYQIMATEIGKSYTLTLNQTAGTGNGGFHLGATGFGYNYYANNSFASSLTFTAVATSVTLTLNAGGNVIGRYTEWDNISLKETSPPELIPNGTFDTNASNWSTLQGGSIVWNAEGSMTINGDGAQYGQARANNGSPITLVVGRQYRVSIQVKNAVSASWLMVNGGVQLNGSSVISYNPSNVFATYTYTFTPTQPNNTFFVQVNNTAGASITIDNFSVTDTTEYIVNGNFEGNLTGVTAGTGTITAAAGRLRVIKNEANIGRATIPITCIVGRQYTLNIDCYKATTNVAGVSVTLNASSVSGSLYSHASAIDGSRTVTFIATQTNHWIMLDTGAVGAQGQYAEFDNISVKEQTAFERYYLDFDGVNQYMYTNNIDCTIYNQLTAFAAIRKNSDTSVAVVAEPSDGSILPWTLNAPRGGVASAQYGLDSRVAGVTTTVQVGNAYTAPHTAILTGMLDLTQSAHLDRVKMRVNGILPVQLSTGSAGVASNGGLSNYPWYIGARRGGLIPFNGRIYGLVIRTAKCTDVEIDLTENWLNRKIATMPFTLPFSPAFLFRNNEQGAWYDPSDLSSMYSDGVGSPVSLNGTVAVILDKSKGMALGPELITNGSFENGTTGFTSLGSLTVNGQGQLVVENTSTSEAYATLSGFSAVTGKVYVVEFDKITTNNGSLSLGGTRIGLGGSTGRMRKIFVATNSNTLSFGTNDPTVGSRLTIDNISLREILGNHAIAITPTSARPTLRSEPGLLGPELAPGGGTFDSSAGWGVSAGWTISGGLLTAGNITDGASTYATSPPLTIGKTYQITYTISNYVSGGFRAFAGTGAAGTQRTANGTYTETLTCTSTSNIILQAFPATANYSVDNVSYKEVLSTRYYLDFDGVDDLLASPTGGAWGDFTVMSGLMYDTLANSALVYSSRSGLTGHQMGVLNSGTYSFQGGNGSTFGGSINGTVTAGSKTVQTGVYSGTGQIVYANSAQVATGSQAWSEPPNDGFTIGRRDDVVSNQFDGKLYGFCLIDRVLQDVERLALDNHLSKLTGAY